MEGGGRVGRDQRLDPARRGRLAGVAADAGRVVVDDPRAVGGRLLREHGVEVLLDAAQISFVSALSCGGFAGPGVTSCDAVMSAGVAPPQEAAASERARVSAPRGGEVWPPR